MRPWTWKTGRHHAGTGHNTEDVNTADISPDNEEPDDEAPDNQEPDGKSSATNTATAEESDDVEPEALEPLEAEDQDDMSEDDDAEDISAVDADESSVAAAVPVAVEPEQTGEEQETPWMPKSARSTVSPAEARKAIVNRPSPAEAKRANQTSRLSPRQGDVIPSATVPAGQDPNQIWAGIIRQTSKLDSEQMLNCLRRRCSSAGRATLS